MSTPTTPAPAAPPARITGLDGLRGVAALIVVFYHLSLVARPFLDTRTEGDVWWWLTRTPLKVLTAGTEAVLVFFVLSGLVVALPALRSGFRWLGYYGGRMLRLYLPVWGSLALAAVLIALLPRDPASVTPGSWIVQSSALTISWPQLLSEASLTRASYDVNNVLWSLRWELVFSLALPLFVVVARALVRAWPFAALVAVAATVAGRVVEVDALIYLPVFFLGVLMAVRLPELRAATAAWSRRAWVAITAASLALLIGSWLARPLDSAVRGVPLGDVLWGLAGVGAAGLVLVVVGSRGADAALSRAVPSWLGRISFSLYLVQAPVIAALAFALGDARWTLIAALGVPACLLVAWLFYLGVERPSHRLARRVTRSINSRRAPQTGSTRIDNTLPAGSKNQQMGGPNPD